MSNVVRFPDLAEAREQAALWIVRMERGLTQAEQRALREWLLAAPRHRELLLEAAGTWDRSDVLASLAALYPRSRLRIGRPAAWRLLASGAALLVLLAMLVSPWRVRAPTTAGGVALTAGAAARSPQSAQPYDAEYQTVRGEQRHVPLPDGSALDINTDSLVLVHYTAAGRDLELVRGEALFKVAKDAHRVFTVKVGGSEFRAVGTAFNLRLQPAHEVQLTVTEGRVRVLVPAAANAVARRPGDAVAMTEIMVDAGKAVTVADSAQRVAPLRPAELAAATAWTQGMIQFDAVPLAQAVREIGRYTPVSFVIDDAQLASLPVTGYFRTGDIDGLVDALQANFPIEVRREGDRVHLGGRPAR